MHEYALRQNSPPKPLLTQEPHSTVNRPATKKETETTSVLPAKESVEDATGSSDEETEEEEEEEEEEEREKEEEETEEEELPQKESSDTTQSKASPSAGGE